MKKNTKDAASAFLTSQLTYIENQIFEKEYPLVTYASILPIDTSAPEGAVSVEYYTIDRVGMAKWIAANGGDIPLVEVSTSRSTIPIELGGVGFQYNREEIRNAEITGQNLRTDKANAAREAYEEFIDRTAFLGDSAKGLTGFLTNTTVPRADAPNGGGGSFEWPNKTSDEIVFDINDALTSVYATTKNRNIPSRILLPATLYGLISGKRMGTSSDKTVLNYVKENNLYTNITGQPLEIMPNRYLEKFPDTSSTFSRRMVAYTPTSDVVVFHIPKPLEFYEPQAEGYVFKIPGDFKVAGVEIRKPLTMKFVKIANTAS